MRTVVIGGGLIGISTAYLLQQQGHQVELLEAREAVGLETSYANGGLLTPAMSDPWNGPGVHKELFKSFFNPDAATKVRFKQLFSLVGWGLKFLKYSGVQYHGKATIDNYRLASYSVKKTAELSEALSLQYDQLYVGSMKVFRSEAAMAGPLALAKRLAEFGLEYRVLNAAETVAFEPSLKDIEHELVGALHFPGDVSGDAHEFCNELSRQFVAAGGVLRTGIQVTKLVVKGGRVQAVQTSEALIEADQVVVAAGSYTPKLLKAVGVAVPIKPVKGYSATVSAPSADLLPKACVIDDAKHIAVASLGNRLRMVSTAEFSGYDASIDQDRIDALIEFVKGLYPDMADQLDFSQVGQWAGLRAVSCDGKPYIGACDVEGVYINSGHGHLGWTMAMGAAHLLTDLMAGRQPEIDPTPFQYGR